MTDAIIVINSGSTSLKCAAYFGQSEENLRVLTRGEVDLEACRFAVADGAGRPRHA